MKNSGSFHISAQNIDSVGTRFLTHRPPTHSSPHMRHIMTLAKQYGAYQQKR